MKTDLEFRRIKGRVKSIVERRYEAVEKFGEIVEGKPDGNDLEVITFDENGFTLKIDRFNFDYSKKLAVGDFKRKENEIEILWRDSTGSPDVRAINKLNECGNMIEREIYDKSGKLTSKSKYIYDDKGNCIESNSYDSLGQLTWKRKEKYNDRNLCVESMVYDKSGNLSYGSKMKYDINGNMVKHLMSDENGKLYGGGPTEYKYVLDNIGNVIRSIEFRDAKPEYITNVKIEYFE